jgi:hypothetical protein
MCAGFWVVDETLDQAECERCHSVLEVLSTPCNPFEPHQERIPCPGKLDECKSHLLGGMQAEQLEEIPRIRESEGTQWSQMGRV